VEITIKEGQEEAFTALTKTMIEASRTEEGVVRLDFVQRKESSTNFALFEVYDKFGNIAKHRETDHYQVWREAIKSLQASEFVITKTECHVFPTTEQGWDPKLESLADLASAPLDMVDHE